MPIVGVGHSWGGAQLANLAFMHPRLMQTIVFLDPVIQLFASSPENPNPAQASTFRKDVWKTKEEAIASFRKSKFYQSWDPRVLDAWIEHGIRATPTSLYSKEDGAVTLSTTKHQEVLTFLRPNPSPQTEDGRSIVDRSLIPDLDEDTPVKYPFYRPEPAAVLNRMNTLRPSAFYIFGGDSPMSRPESREQKLSLTGIGVGGNGGVKEGNVDKVVLKDIGHLVAMEAPGFCADNAAPWLGKAIRKWQLEQDRYLEWTKKSIVEKSTVSEEWKVKIGGPLPRGPQGREAKL
jgi:pimeloyl-ACP methyl ester carboxylesterase